MASNETNSPRSSSIFVPVPGVESIYGTSSSTLLFFDTKFLDKATFKKSENKFIFDDNQYTYNLIKSETSINLLLTPKSSPGAVKVATNFVWPMTSDNNAQKEEIIGHVANLWKYLVDAVQKTKNIEGGLFNAATMRGLMGGSVSRKRL